MERITSVGIAAAVVCLAAFPATADDPVARGWLQYQHDASRRGLSAAAGPRWPEVVPGWPASCPSCVGGAAVLTVPGPPPRLRRTAVFVGTAFENTVYGFDEKGDWLAGWPVALGPSSLGGTLGHPAVAYADGRGQLYAAPQTNEIFSADLRGEVLGGAWPYYIPGGYQFLNWPGLALDRTLDPPEPILYVPTWDSGSSGLENWLVALRPDGFYRPGWPVPVRGSGWLFTGPAVATDGTVYMAASTIVHGFTPAGSPKAGWPVELRDDLSTFISGPAVGLDGTVYVAAYDLTIEPSWQSFTEYYALSPDGEIEPGWPVRLDGRVAGTPGVAADGTSYVSTLYEPTDGGDAVGQVYAFAADGSPRAGWPKTFPDEAFVFALGSDGSVFFACDVDTVCGYDGSGEPLPGWPLTVEGAYALGYPVLADDGVLLFTDAYTSLWAVRSGSPPSDGHRSGTVVRAPRPLSRPAAAPGLVSIAGVPLPEDAAGEQDRIFELLFPPRRGATNGTVRETAEAGGKDR